MTFPDYLTVIDLKKCDSTNSYLKENLSCLSNHFPVMVTAEEQTSGRGRQDRNWVSEGKLGLTSSIGVRLSRRDRLNFLPLITGICVAELLNEVTGGEFVLKWPNDILCKNKKIAGILIENSVYREEVISIIGIGINVNYRDIDFDRDFSLGATSIRMICNHDCSIRELNVQLVNKFFHWLRILNGAGETEIVETYRKYGASFKNKEISFHYNRAIIRGKFIGISGDGGLILELDGETKVFYSGEILP